MNKKKLIITVSALLLVLILGVTVSFQFFYIPYNAVIYSHAEDMLLEEFLDENKIGGAFYENPDYVESFDYMGDRYIQYNDLPRNRTFIVKDKETFSEIFKKDAIEVDFESEMLLIYTFPDSSFSRECYISGINMNKKMLTVKYKKESVPLGFGSSHAPAQRWFVIKMDKLDIEDVKFIKEQFTIYLG